MIDERSIKRKQLDEDNLEAINDLSEDLRKEIDNIYLAIA